MPLIHSLLDHIFLDVVGLHSDVTVFVYHALVAALFVLLIEAHLGHFLHCRKDRGLFVDFFEAPIVQLRKVRRSVRLQVHFQRRQALLACCRLSSWQELDAVLMAIHVPVSHQVVLLRRKLDVEAEVGLRLRLNSLLRQVDERVVVHNFDVRQRLVWVDQSCTCAHRVHRSGGHWHLLHACRGSCLTQATFHWQIPVGFVLL